MTYQTNQAIKNQALSDIKSFLLEKKADKELVKEVEFLEEHILNLECNIELNTTLAEEEKTIKEITHHDEE